MTGNLLAGLALGLAGLGDGASADVPRESLLACRKLADEGLRLRCYDELAQPPPQLQEGEATAAVSKPQEQHGGWTLEETINPLDDTPTVVGSLVATEGKGSLGRPITLYIRCESGKTEAYILWNEFFGLAATVMTRFDQNESTSREWVLSTDHQATFFPGNAMGFVARVSTASRLAAQVTPTAGKRATAVFDLSGAKGVVEELRKACSW